MSPWSAESRAKRSAAMMGHVMSPEVRAKISANNACIWAGKKMPAAMRQKMSDAKKGVAPWNKGVRGAQPPVSDVEREQRRVRARARIGALNPGWKGGVTPLRTRIWRSHHYRAWREQVFVASNYTCQLCGLKSGCGTAVRLEADHFPVPFVAYIDRLSHEISDAAQLYEAAVSDCGLWAASGRALCARCHNTTKRGRATRNFLRAKSDELQLSRHL